ncbi:MAG: serine hydrolase, partial [Rhodothermales bacterium]|nr:serine hydrolase [Rhodothermales bacterium]
VRDRVFSTAGMKDTDSYEVDAHVPNLATGYVPIETEDGVKFERENIFLHSARGTPAGGGYSTAEDLLRFDRALRSNTLLSPAFTRFFFTGFDGDPSTGPLDGGVGFAGGGPGINAVLEMEFDEDITVIVLSNYDPPAAEELGSPIMQMVRGMD